eukprot:TRINITY_DN10823_c0_g1_i1.p1 TRINITY_DN10823_c0_g1~~TRINITY_DN10823_c0_g1_i1.p1  ORF type:complete len:192 (+),score=24.40 TRINITY_DN10823_c0_g1_i1:104-679(+)
MESAKDIERKRSESAQFSELSLSPRSGKRTRKKKTHDVGESDSPPKKRRRPEILRSETNDAPILSLRDSLPSNWKSHLRAAYLNDLWKEMTKVMKSDEPSAPTQSASVRLISSEIEFVFGLGEARKLEISSEEDLSRLFSSTKHHFSDRFAEVIPPLTIKIAPRKERLFLKATFTYIVRRSEDAEPEWTNI